jgi:hypothetical protein
MFVDNRFLGEQMTLTTKKHIVNISLVGDGSTRIEIISRKKGTRKIYTLGDEEMVGEKPLPWNKDPKDEA